MADPAFGELLDASLRVLKRNLLEAYSEAAQGSPLFVERSAEKFEAELQSLKGRWNPDSPTRPSISFSPQQGSELGEPIKEDEDVEDGETSEDVQPIFSEEDDSDQLKANPNEEPEEQAVRKAMLQRLQVRLNVLHPTQLVSGRNLHDAVGALGLTSYTVEDMNEIIKGLAKYIDLKLLKKDDPKLTIARSRSNNSIFDAQGQGDFAKAIWRWPILNRVGIDSPERSSRSGTSFEQEDTPSHTVVPAKALMDLFTTKDGELPKRIFGPRLLKQFQAMREILVAGDTNRLVAELTFVRINDLAAPPEALDPLFYIEPIVAVLIVVNGIMIGFQTDPTFEGWSGWPYIEVAFAVLLVLECVVRFSLSGCQQFFCGPDVHWNLFDMFLVLTAVTDVVFQLAGTEQDADMFGASLLRFCRLIRLVRVVKVFRLNYMKELRLMVKGLVAGMRTLLLSFALLFAVLYVISGFATMTLGRDERTAELDLQGHFNNIPRSMFTAFRCFSGECFADSGLPIAAVLSTKLGWSFAIFYVLSCMLVSLGIFNVILAVYVDITMRAAKETEVSTAEQYSRESIRIARTTRELLKKFAEAHRVFYDRDEGDRVTIKNLDLRLNSGTFLDDDISDTIAITKELFLLVIQDQRVQQLMNDLDLPADRANLFEVIDADGTSTLNVTELVQGLLKIRGELTKRDTVAVLLTAKAVHAMVLELKKEQQSFREALLGVLANQESMRRSLAGGALYKPPRNPKVNFSRRSPESVPSSVPEKCSSPTTLEELKEERCLGKQSVVSLGV
ncbi:unnamed protein product [Durusdinium trenchii]|uniref:Ion transport domain-containing protein n=2 Tax=Durusdinium trenchii TaxID=1381693 RepID=A0ABP0R9R9_9DINO